MKIQKRKPLFLLLLLIVKISFAEVDKPTTATKSKITGTVIDAQTEQLLEYANIAVYNQLDSSLIGGGITNMNGIFEVTKLNPGKYYLDAKFIGYERTRIEDIVIDQRNANVNIGKITLQSASESIGEITVMAQEQPIVYAIDKKVVDPSKMPGVAGGTAVDILANTPSVSVDIEGNVSMRGSSSFTVLIDGRPTPFTASDALEQIPASTIQNIELITNPSAKYDPEGTAGIINIITKKSKLTGISGIVNASGSSNGAYNGDFLLNYKKNKINMFVGGSLSDRFRENTTEQIGWTFTSDTIFTDSEGTSIRGRESMNLKAGIDYYINDFNTLSFSASRSGRSRYNESDLIYTETQANINEKTTTFNLSDSDGDNSSFTLNYDRKFDNKDQTLTAYAYYQWGDDVETSEYEQYDDNDEFIEGQNSWEGGTSNRFEFRTDYTHPLGNNKLETGYQLQVDQSDEWNDLAYFEENEETSWSEDSEYYNVSNFQRNINAVYGIFSGEISSFGYQAGLRGEYTNRSLYYSGDSTTYSINRFDLFPSVHLSYSMNEQNQLMTSYTRRINRPRGYYLEPFLTIVDPYNVRSGNPDINPEYIDSYEIGYQRQLKGGFLSTELFYKVTHNKIERVQSVYEDNILLSSVDNVGTDYSLGAELMFNYKLTKWWSMNLMGSLYSYEIEGEYNGEDLSSSSFNWNSRMNSTFSIAKSTKLQIDGMYNSASTTAQGTREAFAFMNVSVKQDLLDKKLTLTATARDVLNTAQFEMTSSGSDFYSYRHFDMDSPVFTLSASFKLNNYKQQRQRSNSSDMDMEDSEY